MPGDSWSDVLDRTRTGADAHGSDNVTGLVAPSDDAAMPAPGDPYKAAAMPDKHSLTRICCIMGREGFKKGGKAYRYFQYVHLDSDTHLGFTDQGQVITLRFAGGSKLVEVTICGRNLLRICDYIHLHRMAWIRVADRDLRAADGVPDNKPVITEIKIEEVEQPSSEE